MFSYDGLRLKIVSIVSLLLISIAFWSCGSNSSEKSIENKNPSDSTEQINEPSSQAFSIHGINLGPYLEGQDPAVDPEIDEHQLRTLMEIIKPHVEWIRTYGCTTGLEKSGEIAHDLGLKVAMGAWLGSNASANDKEIDNLVNAARAGQADILIVGSEVLHRGDLTVDRLIAYIDRVRQETSGIPIAYADDYSEFMDHPSVIDAVDVIFVNYYPYWESVKVEQATAILHSWHQQILALAGGKKVVVSETGWPSGGNPRGEAVPSPENASYYFLNFVSWAKENNVEYFYFEAFDERWKAQHEGPQGANWGIWDEAGTMKAGMEDVFNGKTMENNWSCGSKPGGEGDPLIEFTYVPPYGSFNDLKGRVRHVDPSDYKVAVYINVAGGWWTKPYWSKPRISIQCDGAWVADITTGGIDHKARKIAAYLIPNFYHPPLMSGHSSLPSELDGNSVAKVEVAR